MNASPAGRQRCQIGAAGPRMEPVASTDGGAGEVDPLGRAEACFRALKTYQATLHAHARGGRRIARYFFRKPGWVRMELIQPYHGMILIYDPDERGVRLWPFGAQHGPVLHFSPDHPLLRDHHGHRIDQSDVGALLDNLRALRAGGALRLLQAAQPALGFEVAGGPHAAVGAVRRYCVWLAQPSGFPIRIESYDGQGERLEHVEIRDVQIDVDLPHDFFAP